MGWMARWCNIGLVGSLVFLAAPARAQSALAEELFRQGQALMKEEKYPEACSKLAESQRLDPSTGTLLNLAVCHEKEGKLASAWTEFTEAASRSKRDGRADRAAFAEEHLRAVEPRLSRLIIVVPQASEAPELKVALDGTAVGQAAWGVPLPVDPGVHQLIVTAPGRKKWESALQIPLGPSEHSVTVPPLAVAPADSEGSGAAMPPPSDGSTQRWFAYGLGGLGLVGVGLGAVFGFEAMDEFNRSNREGCSGDECNGAGTALRNDARSAGDWSTAAFIVGGAALGAGIVLYFTAPEDGRAHDQVAWRARLAPRVGGGAVEWGASW